MLFFKNNILIMRRDLSLFIFVPVTDINNDAIEIVIILSVK